MVNLGTTRSRMFDELVEALRESLWRESFGFSKLDFGGMADRKWGSHQTILCGCDTTNQKHFITSGVVHVHTSDDSCVWLLELTGVLLLVSHATSFTLLYKEVVTFGEPICKHNFSFTIKIVSINYLSWKYNGCNTSMNAFKLYILWMCFGFDY